MTNASTIPTEIEQIYRYAPVGLCLMDPQDRLLRINDYMARIIGLPVTGQVGRTLRELVPNVAEHLKELYRPIYDRGEPVLNAEFRCGSSKPAELQRHWLANFFPLRSSLGEVTGLIGALVDISALRQAQASLLESENRFRTFFDSVNDIIFVYDVQTGAFIEVNQRACETFGYTRDELLNLHVTDLSENVSPHTVQDVLPHVEKARSGMPQTFEWRGKTKAGRLFWVEVSLRRAALNGRDFLLATARDIAHRKQEHEQLKRQAQLDVLTGLANRGGFVSELKRAIEHALRGGGSFAVLYLDLDHFKRANDTLGHGAGDRLLQAVAERVAATVRSTDTVARFGGDEFALLLRELGDPTEAAVLADKLIKAIAKPFFIAGNEIKAGSSIGIAMYDPETPEPETLLAHADVALYRAKSEGRQTYRFFTEAMDAEVREDVMLTTELRAVIAADQLVLAFQPKLDAKSARIVGLEALVRWHHPTRGMLLPGDFVPLAERSGLIVALGNWVLRTACRQIRHWLDAGIAVPPIAINVSALQFKAAPCELEQEVNAVLAETGVPASLLEIELTEAAIMEITQEHRNVLVRLDARGIRIALDDFGAGYSSLSQLHDLPVHRIKLAPDIVRNIGTNAKATAIVKAALCLARELSIGTLAEGVETAGDLELLRQWGCQELQGFYFAPPMSPAAIIGLLRRKPMPWSALGSKHRDRRPRLKFLAR